MQRLRASILLALAAFLSSTWTGCAYRTLTDNPEPRARSVVLLLDASASMRDNDPDKASSAGAALALALAGRHDNVGILAYNERVDIVCPLRPAGDAAARAEAVARLGSLGRSEATDFSPVLDCAFAMLDVAQAPRGSCAIFLTDGLPTGRVSHRREFQGNAGERALEVPDAVAKMAGRGWKIFAIALGPEAPSARPYLTQLVAPTGGAVFEAKDASSLVDVFQNVSVQALGYLSAETHSGEARIQVPPETRRLSFLASSPGGGASVGTIARGEGSLDPGKAVRTSAGPVAAAMVEDPEPGAYRADLGGQRGAALLEPGWTIELEPGSPPPTVQHGARVPVAVSVRAGDASVLKQVAERVRLVLEIRSGAGQVLGTTSLSRATGGLRFEGSFVAPAAEDTLTLDVAASLDVFTTHRSVTVVVQGKAAAPEPPPRALALDASPGRVELAGFADDDLQATLTLRGDSERGASVSLQAPPGFTVSPASVELPAGKSASVTVRAARSDKSASGRLSVVSTALAPNEKLAPARLDLSLSATRGRVETASLDLGTVEAGSLGKGALAASGVSFAATALEGPSGAKLPLVVEPARDEKGRDAFAVAVRVPASAAAGAYSGELVARAGSSTRKIAVTAQVSRPRSRAPEKLAFEGRWGWTSTKFDLDGASADSLRVGTLGLEPSGLAAINPDLDVRTQELAPGKFELRVFVAASLPPGKYLGWLKADVQGEKKDIPIVLEVKR